MSRQVTLLVLPNGAAYTSIYWSQINYAFIPTGGFYANYVHAVGNAGLGYIFAYNLGISSSYPTVTVGVGTPCYVYTSNGSYIAPTYVGKITSRTITYYTVKTSAGTGGSMSGGGEYTSGSTVTITATPDSGYVVDTLNGIKQDRSTGAKSTTVSVSGDMTVSATFILKYTLKFNANGGSGAPSSLSPCYLGTTYYIPYATPTRNGYRFLGWATSKTATSATYSAGSAYTRTSGTSATVTLYAVWKQYTLNYNANSNGNVSAPASQKYYGEITLADALIWDDLHNFDGWTINGVLYSAGEVYTLTGNVTAIAKWSANYKYSLTIVNDNKNAGSLVIQDANGSVVKTISEDSGTVSESFTDRLSSGEYRYTVKEGNTTSFEYEAKGLLVGGEYIPSYTIDLASLSRASDGSTSWSDSYTFYWSKRSSYSVEVESANGRVTIGADHSRDESGKYYLGSVLTFVITPNAGYSHLGYAKIVNTATNDVSNATITNNRFTIDGISCNVKVIVEYEAAEYALSIKAATGHETAFQSLTITDASGNAISSANYGDAVTFTATMKDGYSLLYWHKVGVDTPLGIADSYTMTVTGDAALEVLATVPCTFDVNYKDGDTGDKNCWLSVTYDLGTSTKTVSKQASDIPFTVDVNVSGKVEYALKFGQHDDSTTWKLDHWEADGVALASGASGSVNLTTATSLTAYVANSVTKMLNVYTAWIDAGTDTATLKDAKTRDVFTCQELDISQAAVKGATMAGGSPEETITPTTFIFTGLKYVKLTTLTTIDFSTDNAGQNFRYFSMKAPGDGGAQPADADILTYEDNANFLLSQSVTTVYAYYGTASQVKVSVAYASLSDSTMGTIAIASSTDADAVIADDGLSATVMQGKTFTAQATAFNGYKFAGWFKLATALGDPDATTATASFVVRSAATFYAKFAKDTNMVCEWEGSATNKALVWKSKTYESSKPFNPAACRVDALGYAAKSLLELTVAMFSAPDAEATATTTLTNIASQDARRLPIRRQERYMQVGVKANVEVDALLVGTSMGGLA